MNTQTLSLVVPQPVAAVPADHAMQMFKLKSEDLPRLDAQVTDFIAQVSTLDPQDDGFKSRVKAVLHAGAIESHANIEVSNRMLDRPMRELEKNATGEGKGISTALTDLRDTVEKLDPSSFGDLRAVRKLLGFIPFGKNAVHYLHKFQSSQTQIQAIINTLNGGRTELEADNDAIEAEKQTLWSSMSKFQQYAYVLKKIDSSIDEKLATIGDTDPAKAMVLREEVQFYVRQKTQDMLTQLAVSMQGYLALDMIRKTNMELIKGVDRATTTTVSALRTAVTVVAALSNQKAAIDMVSALNSTTGNLIASTGVMLKDQTSETYKQAASGTIEVEKIKSAFANIYATMDAIEGFKSSALGSMSETVAALSAEVEKSKVYLNRVQAPTLKAIDRAAA